jgi:hypothetical protein
MLRRGVNWQCRVECVRVKVERGFRMDGLRRMMQVLANFSCVRPCSPPVRYPLRLEVVRAGVE